MNEDMSQGQTGHGSDCQLTIDDCRLEDAGNSDGYGLAEAARWAMSQVGPIEFLATHPDRQWRCVYCHAEAAHAHHVTHTADCPYAKAREAIAATN